MFCPLGASLRSAWESVRFASERSRVRIPLGPPICRIVLYDAAFFMSKSFGRPCRAPNPEVGCEPGGVIHVLFENPSFRASFKNRLLLRWAVILRDANNNFNFLHIIDNPPPKPNLYHSIWKIGCSSHFRIDRALRCRVL